MGCARNYGATAPQVICGAALGVVDGVELPENQVLQHV